MVGRSEVKLNLQSAMLSVKWVITNKGPAECPKPKARLVARESVSDAVDRDTLFSGSLGPPIVRSLISSIATAVPSVREGTQDDAHGCDGGFLVRFQREALREWRFPGRIPRHTNLV